jgi:hypothetical protein
MHFGKPRSETLAEQLAVESVRIPRRLQRDVRCWAQAQQCGVSEAWRRLVAAGLATQAPAAADHDAA